MAMAEAFRSSTSRPVGLRYRGDLVTNRQVYQGQAWYVVKDPIGLSYYRFRPEEYALLEMLDGEASLEDLKDNFEERFPLVGSRLMRCLGLCPHCIAVGLLLVIGLVRVRSLMNGDDSVSGQNGKTGCGALCVCGFEVLIRTGFSTSSIRGLVGCTRRLHSWSLLRTYSQHSCWFL